MYNCFMSLLVGSILYLTNFSDGTPTQKGPKIPPLPPPSVSPPPTPLPGGVIPLPQGVELLISDTVKFKVVAFPANLVKIKKVEVKEGREHTLSGTFIDPTDASKITEADQTFTGPCYIYRIRSAGINGTCELYVYEGVDDGVTIKIACGKGPQPPPVDPVTPTDPFTKTLQDAFDLEPASYTDKQGKVWLKADCLSKLAAIYRQTASQIDPTPVGTPPKPKTMPWATYGPMFDDMETASRALLPAEAIPLVRKVIGTRLNDALKPTSLKAIDRATAYSEFITVANAAKEVK